MWIILRVYDTGLLHWNKNNDLLSSTFPGAMLRYQEEDRGRDLKIVLQWEIGRGI